MFLRITDHLCNEYSSLTLCLQENQRLKMVIFTSGTTKQSKFRTIRSKHECVKVNNEMLKRYLYKKTTIVFY